MFNKHSISFEFSSSYITYNQLTDTTENIWIVFHGYGQLSKYFIRRFDVLDADKNYIIAPQGLSKFYVDEDYKNVGASWLTKEDRGSDLLNQQKYLIKLMDELKLKIDFSKIKINFFGFSQGASALTRLLMNYNMKVNNIIIWAGWVPDEFFNVNKDVLKDTNLFFVVGNKDKYYNNPIIKGYIEKFKKTLNKEIDYFVFNGGHIVDRKVLKKINEKL
ncbi:MAG TPA: hypothetical protein EYQ68_05765 [Cytophagales bacterium]|jgi:predicted esterase|nr:hypothetical protein [Cytophagales bacterium]